MKADTSIFDDSTYPHDKTLHQLFEAQANNTPDKIALVFDQQQLTYKQLNDRANQLARLIRSSYEQKNGRAITPDSLIALYLDRGLDMVISILAVLKAGGAYVPIAPEYPEARTQTLLDDMQPGLIITRQGYEKRLAGAELLFADNLSTKFNTDNLAPISTANDLAYVIYTSGTSGQPKGVMVEHHSLSNLIQCQSLSMAMGPDEVVVWLASYIFDASIKQLFMALLNGGRLVIPSLADIQQPARMHQLIEQHKVTYLNATPGYLSALGEMTGADSIKRVITGGEAATAQLKTLWGNKLINAYGPTETTVNSVISLDYGAQSQVNCIGQPVSNTQCYVLDETLSPVNEGELYIGGAGLARGYLNRPDLTAQCFIDNPFATAEGYPRLYKTGDRVRYLPDGNLEYLGRNDAQVKIRGYRIELGEIESVLAQHVSVKQAVVVDVEQGQGKALAAYIVPDDVFDVAALNEYLSNTLPEHMVPGSFTKIEAVPLTINGKLDKQALPSPDFIQSESYVAPRSELEQQLCTIWQDLLGLTQVGVSDNFFAIGGNSIVAIRMAAVGFTELGLDIGLSVLLEHPTIADMAKHLSPQEMTVIPHQAADRYPLSFAQQRLLFIEGFEQGTDVYHIPNLVMLNNDVRLPLLGVAFNQLANRHAVLKSVYLTDEQGNGYQQVLAQDIDIQSHPLLDSQAELTAQVKADISQPFDLSCEPSLRLHHYQVGDEQYLLMLWHHIGFDGWSVDIFMRELSAIYLALCEQRPVDLPELSISYGDYAIWQQGQRNEGLLDYWQRQLSGFETLNLPTDHTRPAQIDYRGKNHEFTLDESLSEQLRALAKAQQTTLYSVLLSGFYITLASLSGQDDIVVGCPTENREQAQLQSLVGFFVNALALRTTVNQQTPIAEFIRQTHDCVMQAKVHQALGFEQLVEALDIERDSSRHPIFQVMFGLQDFSLNQAIELPFTQVNSNIYNPAKFDVSLFLSDRQAQITGQLNYAVSLFDEASIERMAQIYLRVLAAMVQDQNLPIGQIELLSSQERHTLMHSWNQTDVAYPQHKTLHQLFEEQVCDTPDNIALVFEEEQLTYRELNQKANLLARKVRSSYFQNNGKELTPDTCIALYLDRSLETIISILAVLKAGGAYVPMSPEQPKERIQYLLEDSGAKLIITQRRHVEQFDDWTDGLVLADEPNQSYSTDNLSAISGPSDLAYVIYTSGTTGQPKGVMIEHRQIVDSTLSRVKYYQDCSAFLMISDYVFDSSVAAITGTLSQGGKLVISPDNDPHNIQALLCRHNITHTLLTPSFYAVVAPILQDHADSLSLKAVTVAGEKLTAAVYASHMALPGHICLFNEYGPTENSIWTTVNECRSVDTCGSIGKPIANTQCYVLNENHMPVPTGSPGELYIGGAGLARGYLNRPELTDECFINNLFGTRLYKTGDVVRWLSDGTLDYLGRNDSQLKIRGYRIEPGEVERALSGLDDVKQAVVISVNQALVAYVVPAENGKVDTDIIRQRLAAKLPEYMIPGSFIPFDAVPLTINGKLDKRALPEPEFDSATSYTAPRNELEQQLCDIWQILLGRERVGIFDNFFHLGGHSILVIKLVSQVNLKFQSQLSIKDVFDKKCIAKVAPLVEQSSGDFDYQDFLINDAEPVEQHQPFALTNVQQAYLYGRLNSFDMGNVATHGYKELEFTTLDSARLGEVLNCLITRHGALRTVFSQGMQQVLAAVAPYQLIDHGEVDFAALSAIRDRLSHKIYDVSRFPLFDFEVSRYQGKTLVHMSVDALIMDGTSSGIFFDELSQLYNDQDCILPEVSISFGDYMAQYSRIRQSHLFEQAKAYWIDKVGDYNFDAQLPLVADAKAVATPKFVRLSKVIPTSIWTKIEAKAQCHQVSPTSVVLYAYGQVLSKYSGQPSFCINLTLFNRLPIHEQVNHVLGDFTVLELFNFNRKASQTAHDGVGQVHRQLWDDIEHNLFDGIDFQRLVRSELNIGPEQLLSPVVLTSVLGSPASAAPEWEAFLGKGYSITQTSQVYLDNKALLCEDGFVAEWDYVEQLFAPETIKQMHQEYCALIEQLAVVDWHEVMPQLVLSPGHKQVIAQANADTRTPAEQSIVSLCQSGIEANPTRTAVIDEQGSYSFEQIGLFSRRIANYLPAQGGLIGVLSEKGHQQVVATLGIMQSGAGYLPLHVDWPMARIDEVLFEGQVKQVLVSRLQYQSLIKDSAWLDAYQWVIIEDLTENESLPTTAISLPNIKLDDIAYVIFTSGSTGKPKGVTLNHGSVINTILAVNERFNVTEADKVLALSELSFDLSVYDIFGVLAAGGTIVFPAQGKTKDPSHWCDLIKQYQISIWNTVPQLMQILVDHAAHNHLNLNELKAVLMSGDWIPLNLPNQIKSLNEQVTVMSLGGATEGSIWSIWHEVKTVENHWQAIPYGQAMPNQKMYVLNEFGEHNPVDVIGEIHIGGDGVAMGYWQDHEKTQASFFEHPTLGRLYKTGDLGRWHSAGYIEFKGRKDSQVKLNGYRVELEEITTKLMDVKGIDKALTMVQNNQLVAYMVSDKLNKKRANKSTFNPQQFKLEQRGLRTDLTADYRIDSLELDEAQLRLRKSYRHFTGESVQLSKKALQQLAQPQSVQPSKSMEDCLTHLVKPFSALQLADKALPKYLYPSGGSSYAIQTHWHLNGDVAGLSSGKYYYHPVEHYFARSGEVNEQGLLSIDFTVYLPAIEPLYKSASLQLAWLELGHMLALLEMPLGELGLVSQLQIKPAKMGEHHHLATLVLSKSTGTQAPDPYKQPCEFDYLNSVDLSTQDVFMKTSELGRLLNTSSGLIAFKGGTEPLALVQAGYQAQQFTSALYQQDIGSCTLGYVPGIDCSYSIAVGHIDEAAKQAAESQGASVPLEDHLSDHLQQYLPAYMLPQHYVTLDEIPLTANGKVFYAKLPEVATEVAAVVAPRNETERQLCDIWQQALGLEQVSIEDNFFHIGGDSVVAIRVIGQAKAAGLAFSVADLFTKPTIAALAPGLTTDIGAEKYQPFSLLGSAQQDFIHGAFGDRLEDAFPAARLQVGMLMESMLDNSAYHDVLRYRVNAPFEQATLTALLQQQIDNHDVLRMGFVDDRQAGYLAFVVKHLSANIEVSDDGDDLVAREHQRGFDFVSPGLYRLIVSNVTNNGFELTFSLHHAIVDGWSVSNLITELLGAYTDKHQAINIPQTQISYGEYVSAELEACKNSEMQTFWRDHLDGFEAPDFPLVKEGEQDAVYKQQNYRLSSAESAVVIALAEKLGMGVDNIFVALYHQVLCQLQGTSDVTLGLTLNNRLEKAGGDTQLGLFLNTVPFRPSGCNPGLEIEAYIRHIFGQKTGVFEHRALPYSQVQSQIDHGSLFECAFNYTHFHQTQSAQHPGYEHLSNYAKASIPLLLHVTRQHDGFNLTVQAHQHRVDDFVLGQLLAYLGKNVQLLALHQHNLGGVSFNQISEKDQQLLQQWNQTNTACDEDKTLHQLFEQQTQQTPDNIALVYEQTQLSYRELNEKANCLARHIRYSYPQLTPDTLIGLYLDRSIEMVVGMLAVLKAGGAYVPISPDYPQARTQYLLEDSQTPLVITQRHYVDQLATPGLTLIIADEANSLSGADLMPISAADNLAYVIYTSGTTGQPKGVMVEHQAIRNTLLSMRSVYQISKDSYKSSCFSNYVFDVSVSEIFNSLCFGGQLHLLSQQVRQNPQLLRDYIVRTELDYLFVPPAVLTVLPRQAYPSLKAIIFAGESCEPDTGRYWAQQQPLHNYYGPTETAVYASGKQLTGDNVNEIGKPVENTRLYVLDQNQMPVPVGSPGELYIAGAGLARGYLNRPELTAQCFIKNPFATVKDRARGYTRLYKTGDVVRWTPDGNLEYLGRNDAQVKIRGHRIELGEIQSALTAITGIKQAVVIDVKQGLAAYVVAEQGVDAVGLSEKLSVSLPDYMVPASFTQIEAVPLTVNGKLDRAKLPAPSFEQRESYVAPTTELQQQLCCIWQDLLELDRVGIEDNFFAIGGHSIVAIRLVAAVCVELNQNLTLSDLFEHKTIFGLSQLLSQDDSCDEGCDEEIVETTFTL